MTRLYTGGACGVMVTVIENGHSDLSSNPRQGCPHFHCVLGKDINPIILPPSLDKL